MSQAPIDDWVVDADESNPAFVYERGGPQFQEDPGVIPAVDDAPIAIPAVRAPADADEQDVPDIEVTAPDE